MALEGIDPGISVGRAAGMGRRAVLRLGIAASLSVAAGPAFAGLGNGRPRALELRNLHTEETVRATYWSDGTWRPEGLREINYLLRDFRTGDVVDIDPHLLDLMYRLAALVGTKRPFEIISGYRSPATNARLARQSSGIAKNSMHLQGKAVDFRLPGIRLSGLRRAAMSLQGGGVGYYPKSGFIHIDTGRVRYW